MTAASWRSVHVNTYGQYAKCADLNVRFDKAAVIAADDTDAYD